MDQILSLYNSASQNMTPAIAEDLIRRAINAPKLYTFGEFYQLIRKKVDSEPGLQDPSVLAWLGLLVIFTYGTWQDYLIEREAGRVPELDEAQTTKLKELTLASLASQTRRLHYSDICDVLDIERSQLESFLVDAIYSGLVTGKLDTKRQLLEVESVVGRDVDERRVTEMDGVLDGWLERTAALLRDTESYIDRTRRESLSRTREVQEYNEYVARLNDNVRT